MKIVLADHFGICFGVRDAIAQADSLAREAPLTILGELVHNPIVGEQLQARGIAQGSLDRTTSTSHRVMITAHGASNLKREAWQHAGFDVIDGTCPLVRHAHDQLKQLVGRGFFPIVIGKHGHVEVRGLTEDFPEAVVIEASGDISRLPVRDRYGVISQTTQSIDQVRTLVAEIQKLRPDSEVRFLDTVCRPTKDRQHALRKLITISDAIVVVGGHHSNNTRQLVETCLAAGKPAFHIERADELKSHWFARNDVVGLTAGTSTLPETVYAVRDRLLEFFKDV
jgi:4-hydroxy-3-methylbut-2-enyl diphosphate reductase